jgi:hypothetical protein
MKPLNWDNKQLGLASPLQSAASQSGQPITLARMRGLDVSHHTRISPRGGEKSFFLTSSFIGRVKSRFYVNYKGIPFDWHLSTDPS